MQLAMEGASNQGLLEQENLHTKKLLGDNWTH